MFTFIVGAIAAAILFAISPVPARSHEGIVHDGCSAEDAVAGDITVSGGFSRATLPNAPVGAGYLSITNAGGSADRLISASSEIAPAVELHTMTTEGGMMKMEQLKDGIVLPPGETVTLAPGGLHIMFIGPNQPFVEGECVALTLKFEQAGDLPVMLKIGPVGASGAPDEHGGHGGHSTHGAAPAGHDARQHHSAATADAHHGSTVALDQSGMSDVEAIAAMQKAMFETPDNPLDMGPIVVAGEYAISGWAQSEMGGRALLRKTDAGWAIHLCAGAGLKDAANLVTIGVPEAAATELAAALAEAEAALPVAQVALYDSFDGTMMVDDDLI